MELCSARRILLCLRYGIGDLVMEMPSLDALRCAVPEAHITALGARPAIELLEGDPRVDALESVQEFGFRDWGGRGNETARNAFRAWYRRKQFDAVLDPSHAVAGAGSILREEPYPLLCDAGPELQAEALSKGFNGAGAVRYAVEQGWGIQVRSESPRLHVGLPALKQADAALAQLNFDPGAIAALSPSASSPLKRWPVENFVAAGRYLVTSGLRVAVFAGPGEIALAETICEALPIGTARCFGARHLQVTAALLSRCRLLLCNDTGLMHMAAAVGATPVAVFGPTSPNIYAPSGAIPVGGQDVDCLCRRVATFGPPDCVAEGRCARGDGPCIEQVKFAQVAKALDRARETQA